MRGVGLSDPIDDLPTLEDWADDVRAVHGRRGIRACGLGRAWASLPSSSCSSPPRIRSRPRPGDRQRVCAACVGRRLSVGSRRRGTRRPCSSSSRATGGRGRALGVTTPGVDRVPARTGVAGAAGAIVSDAAARRGEATSCLRHRRSGRPAEHHCPHAGDSLRGTTRTSARACPVPRRPHRRGSVRRAAELPTMCRSCRGHRPPHGRDRGVPDRDERAVPTSTALSRRWRSPTSSSPPMAAELGDRRWRSLLESARVGRSSRGRPGSRPADQVHR